MTIIGGFVFHSFIFFVLMNEQLNSLQMMKPNQVEMFGYKRNRAKLVSFVACSNIAVHLYGLV